MFRKLAFNTLKSAASKGAASKFIASGAARVGMKTFAPATVQVRGFSNMSLSEMLSQEFAHEQSNEEIDQELLDSIDHVKQTFTITDKAGLGVVTLDSKYNDETIQVKFDCQNEDESEVDYNMEEEEVDEDEAPSIGYGILFEVAVQKGGETVEFACVAGETLQIRNVSHMPAGARDNTEDDLDVYGGPRFEDLEEEVQQGFYDYLAARKIDDDFSHFVLSYSRKKEQDEYMNWLNGLSKFTAK